MANFFYVYEADTPDTGQRFLKGLYADATIATAEAAADSTLTAETTAEDFPDDAMIGWVRDMDAKWRPFGATGSGGH